MSANPYVIDGEIVVQNGAILTIDPGVVIYMAANSALTVQAGSIQAEGTALAPIRVLSDKTRRGQVAAPGDWKQWSFKAGTVNTRLKNVVFEHGSGLVVNGCAPVFNDLEIRGQQGAAISIDLTASPTGAGNRANANTLNAIAVPAGDITGRVQWGLKGIPYVITSGVLSVGATPAITSITPNTLQQGETITATLTGTRLKGLASAQFDQSGLDAQVLPGATDTQATLSITAGAEVPAGSSGLKLLTDAGEARLPEAVKVMQSQPALSSLAPSALYTGQGTVDVAVVGRNLSAKSVVLANGAVVPTEFESSTRLKARIAALAAPGNVLVRVRTPNSVPGGADLLSNELAMPVIAAQLVVTPSTVTAVKGGGKTMSLNLPYAAGPGGLDIALVSSVPAVATVPATVSIPEGQNTASFTLTASELGNTTITASRVGYLSGQALVTVITPPSLTFTPPTLTLGVNRTVDLLLQSSTPAPAGGLMVELTSSNAAAATVPGSISIPAGATSATTQVSTVAVGSTTISAQASDYVTGQSLVTVRPTSLNLPTGALVAPGLSRSIPLTLSDPAPAGGLLVTLESSSTATASVPSSINVGAGQTSVNFMLTAVAAGAATIKASASGYEQANLPVVVEAVSIKVGSPAVSSISLPVDNAKSYAVTLSRPAPAGGVDVKLGMDNASTAMVAPSTISIAEGQTSGGTVLAEVTGVAKGATVLTASSPGLNGASLPVNVTAKPVLSFSTSAVTVGKGLTTYYYEVRLRRTTDGSAYSPADALTVNLASSDASKASVPATVTIPANSSEVYFYVTGVDLTGGTPATVDATAAGYTSPTTKLAVNVVAPVFNVQSLDTNRSPASARDDFTIYVTTPGAAYSGSQTAAADMPIDLSIVEDSPSGIVDGFYSALSGGTRITQIVLRKGSTTSDTAYAGTPTAAGSYKVRASAAGVATGTSGATTVSAPQLQFTVNSVTVGKGLNTYYYEARVRRVVNGTAFNGVDALTVNLNCSSTAICQVPSSVVIPVGSSDVYFYVTGMDVGSTTVTAGAVGYSASQDLAVNVVQPQLNFSGPGDVQVGAQANFSVYLTTPGASYSGSQMAVKAFNVDLTSSAPGVATVPPAATIAIGSATSSSVKLTGVGVGTTTLTASGSGLSSATSGVITIKP